MTTSDCFHPSHPTKMEEPQTAVLSLLGLISVGTDDMRNDGMTDWLPFNRASAPLPTVTPIMV